MASADPTKKDVKTTKDAPRDTTPAVDRTYLRAENEDDDGYDPYSDRPATPEPLFERDPWA